MKLLVLAGGFGTRLRSVVSNVPKALAPVGNVSFLYLQLEHWIAQGVGSFVFLLHHQADLIIGFLQEEQSGLLKDCDIQWLVEPTPMDTGGAVAYAVEQLKLSGDFLVTNADTWLGSGIRELCQAGSPSMVVVKVADAGRYGNVQFDDVNFITAFKEKTSISGMVWINAGLYHLNAELFQAWKKEPFSLEQSSFTQLAAQGKLKAVPLQTNFIDIGIPEDYFRFCRWIESGKIGVP
jgi:D-glycero-alpha-D-manno-heptose 1-phosphate guanylyltransferase